MPFPPPYRPSPFRPCLEALEDRLAPALVAWTGLAGDGNWGTALNWSSRAVPTAVDDVFLFGAGTITHSGTSNDSVHSIRGDQPLVVSGGTLTLGTTSQLGNLTLTGGELKILTGTLTLDTLLGLPGGFFRWTGGALGGPGTVQFHDTSYLNGGGSPLLLDNLTIDNYGTLTWAGGRIASQSSGGHSYAGAINEAGATFTVLGGSRLDSSFVNLGELDFSAASNVRFGDVSNSGTVELLNGTLHAASYTQLSGTTTLEGGNLKSDGQVVLLGGTLAGHGMVGAPVDNEQGTVAPDAGLSLRIFGDYTQESGGALSVTVAGGVRGSAPLVVQAAAALDGSLSVALTGAVLVGDSYPVVQANSVSGQFAQESLPLAVGDTVSTAYGATKVSLVVSATVASTPPVVVQAPVTTTQTTSSTTVTSVVIISSTTQPVPTTTQSGGSGPAQQDGTTTPQAGGQATAQQVRAANVDMSGLFVTAVGGTGGGTQGTNRPADQAAVEAGSGALVVRTTIASPALPGTERSGGRLLETDGAGDEELGFFRLVMPEVNLPSEKELLSAGDVAGALLTGGRARTDVRARSGSQLSMVATVVTGEEEVAGEARVTLPVNDLFLNPMMRRIPRIRRTGLPTSAPAPQPDLPAHEEVPSEEAAPARQGKRLPLVLLVTSGTALGMMVLRHRWPRHKARSGGQVQNRP
jgi:hypothetical protein